MEKIILRKNAERNSNKVRLPKFVIEKMGRNYYMEIYEDKIILVPMKNRKE